MIVRVAKTAGFCFGVERTVRKAEEMISDGSKKNYSYGPVVHNESVIEELGGKGLSVIDPGEKLPEDAGESRLIIRAHGVGKETRETLEASFSEVIDATCPYVKKIHRLVEKASRDGAKIVIVGNAGHPEVRGIAGWAGSDCFIADTEESIRRIPYGKDEKIFVVVQTTFQPKKFKKILEILNELGYNANIADTVCSATVERQEEAKQLASQCDVMLVIGSETSSNSQKLYEICKEKCDHTHFIQKAEDIRRVWFRKAKSVGITAGASTPKKIIEEVQNYVRV